MSPETITGGKLSFPGATTRSRKANARVDSGEYQSRRYGLRRGHDWEEEAMANTIWRRVRGASVARGIIGDGGAWG